MNDVNHPTPGRAADSEWSAAAISNGSETAPGVIELHGREYDSNVWQLTMYDGEYVVEPRDGYNWSGEFRGDFRRDADGNPEPKIGWPAYLEQVAAEEAEELSDADLIARLKHLDRSLGAARDESVATPISGAEISETIGFDERERVAILEEIELRVAVRTDLPVKELTRDELLAALASTEQPQPQPPVPVWDLPVATALDEIETLAGFSPDRIEWDQFRYLGNGGGPMTSVGISAYQDLDDSGVRFKVDAAGGFTVTHQGVEVSDTLPTVLRVSDAEADRAKTLLQDALTESLATYNDQHPADSNDERAAHLGAVVPPGVAVRLREGHQRQTGAELDAAAVQDTIEMQALWRDEQVAGFRAAIASPSEDAIDRERRESFRARFARLFGRDRSVVWAAPSRGREGRTLTGESIGVVEAETAWSPPVVVERQDAPTPHAPTVTSRPRLQPGT